uniref:Periplasmic divalent cation tolerance protein n=1 Tax=Acetithermum autotrophicum TaxID=1446466 RepID=H5SQK4_ACEAU|nr:periplasmic divalent cation tolerance protein [Candidatus Acetothermum autotrophicum]
MPNFVQVVTTVASKDEGERIARALLEQRLAACVQIVGPIESFYWWQGKINKSEEWMCIAKTEMRLFQQIEETMKALHSYEVPEILAVPVSAGSDDYLQWLAEQVHQERG